MSEEQKAQMVGKIALLHKDIEKALRRVGASGNGVKELLESIQKDLEKETVRYIRECNHLRNLAIHDGILPSETEFEIYKIKSQQVCTDLGNLPDGYYTSFIEENTKEISVIQDSSQIHHNLAKEKMEKARAFHYETLQENIKAHEENKAKNKGVIGDFVENHPVLSAISGLILA